MKPTSEMAFKELIDYWKDNLCAAINRDDFRAEIALMLTDTLNIGFERGVESTKNKLQS